MVGHQGWSRLTLTYPVAPPPPTSMHQRPSSGVYSDFVIPLRVFTHSKVAPQHASEGGRPVPNTGSESSAIGEQNVDQEELACCGRDTCVGISCRSGRHRRDGLV